MFEKFGKMESFEEINKAAEGLKNEGDIDGLRELAEENGLSDLAEYYIVDEIPALCGPLEAAEGRLNTESEDLEIKGLMKDWVEYIKTLCVDSEAITAAVLKKDLAGCMGELLKESFNNRIKISQSIVKKANIGGARVEFGIPDMAKAKEIIRSYYGED